MASTFLQSAVDAAFAGTVKTFSAQSLGSAAADRYIAVTVEGASGTGTNSLSGVTIGGVAATQVVSLNPAGGANLILALYIAAVPTGATGDVVITFGEDNFRVGYAAWRLDSLDSATATDSDSNYVAAQASPAPSVGLTVPANGCAISASFTGKSGTVTGAAWTGLTED